MLVKWPIRQSALARHAKLKMNRIHSFESVLRVLLLCGCFTRATNEDSMGRSAFDCSGEI
jgi:elongation factor P--beta-lysine ligase